MKLHLSRFAASMALVAYVSSVWAANEADNSIPRFDIVRFDVKGNTLLQPQAIDKLLAPFTGKQRDFGDVQRALEVLEDTYHKQGYSVVQVTLPEQELNNGVVRFQVIQTRIGKVTVEGNKVFDEANIRRSVPGLREGEIPDIGRISASLRMANENPSKKASLQLQSADKDDEINALLKVDDSRTWRIGANIDNTGNSSSGNTHLGVLYQNANTSGHDDVVSLQYTTTIEKPSKVSMYGVGYHLPLYSLGDSLDLFGSYSNVDSGSVSAGILDLQVSGKGAVYGARYNHNFKRSGDYDGKLIAGLDYKAFKNNVQLQGQQLGNDVTVHPFSVGYAGNWSVSSGAVSYYLTALRNVPGGDNGGDAQFNAVRTGASSRYKIMRYGANFSRVFAKDWQVRLNLSGQYTNDSLVPGEQFGAGGGSSVRGFAEREVANDYGYMGSVEMYTPNLFTGGGSVALQCRALVFYDGASLSRNNPLPGEVASASIGSAGIGLRASLDKYMTLQMDAGRVLNGGGVRANGDTRLHFLLGLSY